MPLDIRMTGDNPGALLPEFALGIPISGRGLPLWVRTLPSDLAGALTAAVERAKPVRKLGETSIVHAPSGVGVCVGIESTLPSGEVHRRATAALIAAAGKAHLSRVMIPLPAGRDAAAAAEAIAVGARLANYRFVAYRSEKTRSDVPAAVETLFIWEPDAARRRTAARGIVAGSIMAEATCRVRDLANTPANELPPAGMADAVAGWCKEARVSLQVLGPAEIAKAGMNAVTAVGGGSAHPPRFLIASHTGRKRQPKRVDVALVGKGVTFDSGGISIKPSADMWEMRGDMAGAAVVMSAICAAAKLRLPVNLIAFTPLVENLPSGTAYRPGDVIRTFSGQTIEIISTDAEGRLILADALTYAQRHQPQVMIDCATLTGAIKVALGDVCAGVFTEHDILWRAVESASQATGERVWRMPLFAEYDEPLKTEIADMRNSAGRDGGASIAARLLRKFTGDLPWVHIDIAGVDLEGKGCALCPKGASGFGARLVIELLRRGGAA